MADDLPVVRAEPFAEALTELEGLMTQSGRAFLIGAGCTRVLASAHGRAL